MTRSTAMGRVARPGSGLALEDEQVPVLLALKRHVPVDGRELPALCSVFVQLGLEVCALDLFLVPAHEAVRDNAGGVLESHAPNLTGWRLVLIGVARRSAARVDHLSVGGQE